jgi:tetratricopeptide (TPR) repeat protein
MMQPIYHHGASIKAIRMLPEEVRSAYTFVFIDKDGDNHTYIADIQAAMEADPSVAYLWLPRLPKHNLWQYIEHADLCVQHPSSDGSAVTALETMYLGTPLLLGPADYDKALFYYHKSIETDEYWADAYLGIGVVMDLQGKLAEAIPFLDKAIDLESKNPDYAIYKMEVLVKMEKFEESISLGEKLVKEFPENEETWMALADAFFKNGNNEKALEIMLEATLVHLSNPDVGYRRAVYLVELGKIQDAQELLHYLMQNESAQLSELEEYYPKILQLPFYIQLKSDLGLV